MKLLPPVVCGRLVLSSVAQAAQPAASADAAEIKNYTLTEQALEQCIDGVLAFDRSLRVVLCNGAMERILYLRRSDALGRSIFEVFPRLIGAPEARCCSRRTMVPWPSVPSASGPSTSKPRPRGRRRPSPPQSAR